MTSVVVLIIISVLLILLMVPVKSASRLMTWTEREGFLTPEIENPPPHLLLGSQSEVEQGHKSDIYSRLATVRIDPYE